MFAGCSLQTDCRFRRNTKKNNLSSKHTETLNMMILGMRADIDETRKFLTVTLRRVIHHSL